MPSFIRLHFTKLTALLLLAGAVLLLYMGAGAWKLLSEWTWSDIIGEGGAGLLTFVWLCLILNSRPAGRITTLLTLGLGLMFLAWWADTLDEFIRLPDTVSWDHWLESLPMSTGMLILTYGLYHWHREQLAISAQLQKRERLFREHRFFDRVTPLCDANYLRRQIELCRQSASQQPLSLIALDMDDFDQVNQRFGHPEGDRVLLAVSQLLLLNLRNQDLLCRLAGDRFVILLPSTGESEAGEIAAELQQAIASFAYRSSRRQHGERIRLRATTAVVMAYDEGPEQLLERLQLALSRAKQPLALRA